MTKANEVVWTWRMVPMTLIVKVKEEEGVSDTDSSTPTKSRPDFPPPRTPNTKHQRPSLRPAFLRVSTFCTVPLSGWMQHICCTALGPSWHTDPSKINRTVLNRKMSQRVNEPSREEPGYELFCIICYNKMGMQLGGANAL